MTFRVVVLPRAYADIRAHARWWAEHRSTQQSTRWTRAVREQIKSLALFPESNGLSEESDAFEYPIRDKLLGLSSPRRHRAVFTIRGDTVYVLAVRHAAEEPLSPDSLDPPPLD